MHLRVRGEIRYQGQTRQLLPLSLLVRPLPPKDKERQCQKEQEILDELAPGGELPRPAIFQLETETCSQVLKGTENLFR